VDYHFLCLLLAVVVVVVVAVAVAVAVVVLHHQLLSQSVVQLLAAALQFQMLTDV
jgi:hypothetical protein